MLLAEVMSLLARVGQIQSVTYSAPFTFPWLETSTGNDASGVTFTAGKHGDTHSLACGCQCHMYTSSWLDWCTLC